MGAVSFGETKRDLFCLLVRSIHNTAICPPLLLKWIPALRTHLTLRLHYYLPIGTPVCVTPSTYSIMTMLCASGLLLLLFAIRLHRLLGRRRGGPEKTFLFLTLLIAYLGLKAPDLLFKLIDPTLLLKTKCAAVDRHGAQPRSIIGAISIQPSRSEREKNPPRYPPTPQE